MTPGHKLVVVVFMALGLVAWKLINVSGDANQASELHVKMIGKSFYDFHKQSGQWPANADDLAKTTLAQQCPHDLGLIENGSYGVVWPKGWDSDPDKNADRILVYENVHGVRDWVTRRVWVCWGDLRAEYITNEQLQDALKKHGQ